MPWCQTSSWKKKAIVFTTLNTYQVQRNAGFSKVCEIFHMWHRLFTIHPRVLHTGLLVWGHFHTLKHDAAQSEMWLVALPVSQIICPLGRVLAKAAKVPRPSAVSLKVWLCETMFITHTAIVQLQKTWIWIPFIILRDFFVIVELGSTCPLSLSLHGKYVTRKYFCFVGKKVSQRVLIDLSVSKWWQNFLFGGGESANNFKLKGISPKCIQIHMWTELAWTFQIFQTSVCV